MRVGKDNSARKRFEEILSGRSLLWMKRRRSVRLDYLQVDCVRSNLLLRSVVAKCGWQVLAGKPDDQSHCHIPPDHDMRKCTFSLSQRRKRPGTV